MEITIQLFATFRTGRFKENKRAFTDDVTVGRVLAELGISEMEIGMALVNGRHASPGQLLNEGEVLALFPMMGGG